MRISLPHPAGRDGYVFILALAAIAALALILAGAYAVQRVSSDGAAELLSQTRLEGDLRSAQVTALYVLLTAPRDDTTVNYGGVANPDIFEGGLIEVGDAINARGEPRRIEINGRTIIIRLISSQGLIGLDPDDPRKARLFLEQAGLDPAEASRLAARLGDYADGDDLRRLGGAERADYPEGREPANAPLRLAREICAVPGWDVFPLCAEDPRLMDLYFTITPGASSHPAFLPDHVQNLLFSDAPGLARLRQAFAPAVSNFADLGLDGWDAVNQGEFGYGPLGSEFLILTHEPQAGLVLAAQIRLTPGDIASPYQTTFDFVIGGVRVEQEFGLTDADELEVFPVPEPPSN
ncbi:MAG: hypothetical protein DHS20C06_02890 [Hyphobacterium sp.]|nr:MAG: hypothetical protein DHS20C06_02890 [Hyphobacterium sp.]